MPRKTKRADSDEYQSKQMKAAEPVGDWRETLYYWHGPVSTDEAGVTTWQGSWIASADGLPSPAEFEASSNAFKLMSNDFLVRDGVPLEDTCPFGRSGYFNGYYKLDNDGTGLRDYSDIEHRIVIKDHTAGWALVGARGTADFGEFISAGRLVFPHGTSPACLTLARRYLADNDPRVHLSAWAAVRQIDSNLEGRDMPWKQLAM